MLNSSFINAMCALLVNFGSGFVTKDIHFILQKIFDFKIMRWLVLFTLCFTTTKDVVTSLTLSLVLVLFVWHLLNEKSDFCILNDNSKISKVLSRIKCKCKENFINYIEK